MTKEKLIKATNLDNDIYGMKTLIDELERQLKEDRKNFSCGMTKEGNDFVREIDKEATKMKLRKTKIKLASLQKEFDKL